VAPPMSGTFAWKSWLAAALAIGYLIAMFAAGTLPEYAHFNEFAAAGLLRESPVAVTRVTVARTARRWALQRVGERWVDEHGVPVAASVSTPLTAALRFMHRAAPVRTLPVTEESALRLRDYGLAAAGLAVVLSNDSGVLLQFELGGRNPDGMLRYLRATGQPDLQLVSGFVGTAWDQVETALVSTGVRAEPVSQATDPLHDRRGSR